MMKRLLNLFRGARLWRDIDKEMTFHIEERVDDLAAQGIPRYDARSRAVRQFGAAAIHQENTWETDILNWLGTIVTDIAYALRRLRKSPGFAAVAIVSLALGIGANTAIFSLIDAVLLRALPIDHPEQLMLFMIGDNSYLTNPMWEQLRDSQDVFSGAFAWGQTRFNVAHGGESRMIIGNWVSGDFFSTLRVEPAQGRLIASADDRRGCGGVAVLSHAYWTKAYGNSNVVGKTIPLEGHPFEIIGVSRAGFTGINVGESPDMFAPICSSAIVRGSSEQLNARSSWWLNAAGRVKPGVSEAQVKARLAVLSPAMFAATVPPRWSTEQQAKYRKRIFSADSFATGASNLRRAYTKALWFLMYAVGLVLLIACANVANLLLARATARQREMAVRLALGAGRARLLRQTLTESLLLAFLGASLGLLFAQWGSRLLTVMLSTSDRSVFLDLHPDWRVLLFTIAAGTLTGVLFGIFPAWRSARVSPNAAMKAQGRGVSDGSSRMRLGKTLVVAQVALSMMLVAGAGLMLATFHNLSSVNPGFRAEGVMLLEVNLRQAALPKAANLPAQLNILERLRTIPGVRSVSASDLTPIGNSTWNEILRFEGQRVRAWDDAMVYFNSISGGYFETLGTPFLEGRDFNAHDDKGAPRVAIVNETMSRHFFGKASPIGRRFQVNRGNDWGPLVEIVGVVRDAKYKKLGEETLATAYMPFTQSESPGVYLNYEMLMAGSPSAVTAAVKDAIAGMNPRIGITFFPLSQQIAESLTRERMLATLSGFFGALALLLAAIGLYGVLSYNVERRRNEIGIRMALGAAQSKVLSMVMGEASWLAFIGLGLGLAGTLAATQLVKTFLFGLQPDDPPTLASSAAMLAAVALFAAYLPARRAAQLDPMVALRDE